MAAVADLADWRVLATGAMSGIVGVHDRANLEAAQDVAADIKRSGGRAPLADIDEALLEAYLQEISMRRIGTAEVSAGVLLFLASDRLSSNVTGQAIDTNGGHLTP